MTANIIEYITNIIEYIMNRTVDLSNTSKLFYEQPDLYAELLYSLLQQIIFLYNLHDVAYFFLSKRMAIWQMATFGLFLIVSVSL